MEAANRAKTIFFLFGFVLFLIIGMYIAIFITSIFKQSKAYSDQTTTAALECNDYRFDVNKLSMDADTLLFTVSVRDLSSTLDTLIIRHNGKDTPVQVDLLPGQQRRLGIPKYGGAPFDVFAKGCAGYAVHCTAEGCK